MRYLIIDVETSGLFDYSRSADAPGQPRLAQVGMILADDRLEIETENEFLIKPVGWVMSQEAIDITGLTTEMLLEHGVEPHEALIKYAAGIDDGRVVAGHNVLYDVKMMRAELRLAGMEDRYIRTKTLCTMHGSRAICKVPNANGKGMKVPKLEEACAFFGIEQPAKHSALADARSVLAIMKKLAELGALPAPKHPLDKKGKGA